MHLPADYENAETRPSGLSAVGEIPWGTHLCQFYRGRADLLDVLVPFFKAGLEANERCLWITSATLGPPDAAAALAQAVPDLPERMRRGQIDIIDRRDWYLRPQGLGAEDVLNSWLADEAATLAGSYDGLRLSGDTVRLERKAWGRFMEYEASVHRAFHSQRLLALCSYSLDKCSATDIIDVLRNHDFALVRREGRWETIRSATQALSVIDVDIPEEEAVDLLDVSRIARGKVELERTPVEVVEVVANALETASPLIEERRHRVMASVPATGLRIEADAARLAQVVANLLINAAKYTPPGGIIRVTAQAQTGRAVLRVRYNGIGIAPDLLPRIFDLFAQGKQGRDRPQGGLGLGLTIARNLTEMHGGTLCAKSDGPGKGAELLLELPLMSEGRTPAKRADRADTEPKPSGRKILVVDDNADAADMLAEALRMFGYAVEAVYDGPSALEIAEALRPEVALLDIGLPAMDGLELAQRLKALLSDAPPKLIALTGYGQAADRRRSQAAGFDAHLTKPIDFQQLRTVLHRVFADA